MPLTVGIAAEKGGVGKSTGTLHLGIMFARAGYRTLAIDLDSQKNMTEWLFGPEHPFKVTIEDLLRDPKVPIGTAVVSTKFEGLSIVPGSRIQRPEILLATLPSGRPRDQFQVLNKVIEQLPDSYDVVLLDAPPGLGTITANIIVASQVLVVPVTPSYLAFRGLTNLGTTVMELLDDEILRSAPPLGVYLSLVRSDASARDCEVDIRDALDGYEPCHIFENRVRYRQIMERIPKRQLTAFDVVAPLPKSELDRRRISKTDADGCVLVAGDYDGLSKELMGFLDRLAEEAAA